MKRVKSPQGSLHAVTMHLLKQSEKSLIEIYAETGISFYWLRKFANGEIKDPSVNRVQELYEHLSGKELQF